MSNIVLVGMMGAGKTTLGKVLSKRTGMTHIDLDQLIESMEGVAIKDLFSIKGEAYFRTLETKCLNRLLGKSDLILSTGGGIVLRAENLSLMKAIGKVVFLNASPECLKMRLANEETQRPVLKNNSLRALCMVREPLYRGASDVIVSVDALGVEDIATQILKEVGYEDFNAKRS